MEFPPLSPSIPRACPKDSCPHSPSSDTSTSSFGSAEKRRDRKDMVVSTEGHLEQGMLWAFPDASTPGSHGHPLKWAGPYCKNSQMQTGKFWPPHPSLTPPPCLTDIPSCHPVSPPDISPSTFLPVFLVFQNSHTTATVPVFHGLEASNL